MGLWATLNGVVCWSRKTDTLAQKQADRKQFDSVTNRIRETQKNHQMLRAEIEAQFYEQRSVYEQVFADLADVFLLVPVAQQIVLSGVS